MTRKRCPATGPFTEPRSSNRAETSLGGGNHDVVGQDVVALAGPDRVVIRVGLDGRDRVEEQCIVEALREDLEPERVLEDGNDEVEHPDQQGEGRQPVRGCERRCPDSGCEM